MNFLKHWRDLNFLKIQNFQKIQLSENSENSNSLQFRKFAVVTAEIRLQDFSVIFGFKAAALAVGRHSDSVLKKFKLALRASEVKQFEFFK